MEKQAMAKKIKALFALAKSSHSEHEAMSAFKKARELLKAHQLNEDFLDVEAQGIVEEFVPYGVKTRPRWIHSCASAIADGFGCRYYYGISKFQWMTSSMERDEAFEFLRSSEGEQSFGLKGFVLYGFELDVEIAVQAFHSARFAINSLGNAFVREFPKKKKYISKMSFCEGCCYSLRTNLIAVNLRPSDKIRTTQGDSALVPVTDIQVREFKQQKLEEYRDSLGVVSESSRGRLDKMAVLIGRESGRGIQLRPGLTNDDSQQAIDFHGSK